MASRSESDYKFFALAHDSNKNNDSKQSEIKRLGAGEIVESTIGTKKK